MTNKYDKSKTENYTRINGYIRAPQVIVVQEDRKLGVFPLEEALRLAREAELDLVEIVPNAKPPVCRIVDYGKFRYELSVKEKEQKKKQKEALRHCQTKGLRLSPSISDHDLSIKADQARDFLSEGHSVQFTLKYKRRENAHKELGFKVFEKLAEFLKENGNRQAGPKLESNLLTCTFTPIIPKE